MSITGFLVVTKSVVSAEISRITFPLVLLIYKELQGDDTPLSA